MINRRLYRSRHNRIIAGVAGGLAEYFNIDPVLVRLLFVVLLFVSGGSILLAYIIAWIIIPEAPENDEELHSKASTPKEETTSKNESSFYNNRYRERNSSTLGIILIVGGLIFLMQNLFGRDMWRNFWPLILVIIGTAIIIKSVGDTSRREK